MQLPSEIWVGIIEYVCGIPYDGVLLQELKETFRLRRVSPYVKLLVDEHLLAKVRKLSVRTTLCPINDEGMSLFKGVKYLFLNRGALSRTRSSLGECIGQFTALRVLEIGSSNALAVRDVLPSLICLEKLGLSYNTALRDEDLVCLAPCLKHLILREDGAITGSCLESLTQLKKLRLSTYCSRFNHRALERVTPRLVSLALIGNDNALTSETLRRMTTLRKLVVACSRTQLDYTQFTQLRSLSVSYDSVITDAILATMTRLTSLALSQCVRVEGTFLKSLSPTLGKLSLLGISCTSVDTLLQFTQIQEVAYAPHRSLTLRETACFDKLGERGCTLRLS